LDQFGSPFGWCGRLRTWQLAYMLRAWQTKDRSEHRIFVTFRFEWNHFVLLKVCGPLRPRRSDAGLPITCEKVHGKRVLKKRTTMIEYQIPFDNPLCTIGVHKGTFIEKSERDEGARFSSNDWPIGNFMRITW